MNTKIYFDANATSPLDPRVGETLSHLISTPLGNPSSPHTYGQAAKSLLSDARRHVATLLHAKQSQIIFTSGGSEGAALSIRALLPKQTKTHIISSDVEHAAVFETLEALRVEGYEVTYLNAGLQGAISPSDLKNAIRPNTGLIVLMGANNETGVMNDIEAIGTIAEQHHLPLIVDGVGLLGKTKFHIPNGVSAMFFSGHKIHAPQGVGFIYLHPRIKLAPLIRGGSQEFGMRGGTENMLGIVGLGKAASLLQSEQDTHIERMREMRDHLENALLALPGVTRNGSGPRVCNTTNLAFSEIDGETFLIALDQAGIAVSLGAACSSGAIEPSRVLLKMGIPLAKARSSIRFSLSRFNTLDEVDKAIKIIGKLYRGSNL